MKIQLIRVLIFFSMILLFFNGASLNADNDSKSEKVEPKIRFSVVDKIEVLTPEQAENIFQIYSDYEDFTSIQLSLLIVNSPEDDSGEYFLNTFSGQFEKRLVIRLVKSTKEVGLFWTDSLTNSLQNKFIDYDIKFEPYLAEGKFYEAALNGSIKIINVLSPEYKIAE